MDALVDHGIRHHGRFPARPRVVNPLDDAPWPLHAWRRTRLKEWLGIAVFHPELWLSTLVQDAKYLATAEVIAFSEGISGTSTTGGAGPGGGASHHQVIGPAGSARLPRELFGRQSGFARRGIEVAFTFGRPGGTHRLRIRAATRSGQPIEADLDLEGADTPPPLSVSAPVPADSSGPARGDLFTYKCIYRVAGTVRVGTTTLVCDPDRDLALLDEHRSRLPHRTDWIWGTFAAHGPDGVVGANFARRPMLPGSADESCLWGPATVAALDGVQFHRDDDPLRPWRVGSDDGRLDVTFIPAHHQTVQRNLGVFVVDYEMCQGRYSGTLDVDGTATPVTDVPGVIERMHARL